MEFRNVGPFSLVAVQFIKEGWIVFGYEVGKSGCRPNIGGPIVLIRHEYRSNSARFDLLANGQELFEVGWNRQSQVIKDVLVVHDALHPCILADMEAIDMPISGKDVFVQNPAGPRLVIQNLEVALQIQIRGGAGQVVLNDVRCFLNGQLGLQDRCRLLGWNQLKIHFDVRLLLKLIQQILLNEGGVL
ncbi:hypothetical protein D3C81_833200 [compost metagenome]